MQGTTSTRRVGSALLASGLCAALLAGCQARIGAKKKLEAVADRLRAENAVLRAQGAEQEREIAELHAKLDALAGAGPTAQLLSALPTVATLKIDRLSGYWPAKGETPARIVVFVRPLDGRGRFTQVLGELTVSVWEDVEGAATAPPERSPNWMVTVGVEELRERYRSGILGTHYVVEFPVQTEPVGRLFLHARMTPSPNPGQSGGVEAVLTRPGPSSPEPAEQPVARGE